MALHGSTLGGGNGTATPPPPIPTDPQPQNTSISNLDSEQFDRILGPNVSNIIGALSQAMSATGALDALFQNRAAREDPTIPALLNTQFQRFVEQQNTGGFDANAFLSGNFSSAAPANPVTLGAGDGSAFDIPLQSAPGVDPIIDFLINALGGQSVDSITGILDFLFQAGGPQFIGNTRQDPETNVSAGGNINDLQTMIDQIFNGGGAASLPASAPADVVTPAPPPPLPAPQPVSPGASAQLPQGNPIQDILRQLQPPQVAQDIQSGVTTPILGRFAQGGTVPQTGAFVLEQGERVIPNAPPRIPAINLPLSPTAPITRPPPFDSVNGQNDFPVADTTVGLGGFQDDPGVTPAPPPPLPPPVQDVAATQPNPLQTAIESLMAQLQGGGLQQNIQDNFSNQLLSSRRNVAEDFGRRGLGGSGIQEQLGLQAELGILNNATQASNAAALGQAQALGGLSLGAGQFGLQQQDLQFRQNQSLFESILRALQGTSGISGDNPVTTTNVNII